MLAKILWSIVMEMDIDSYGKANTLLHIHVSIIL